MCGDQTQWFCGRWRFASWFVNLQGWRLLGDRYVNLNALSRMFNFACMRHRATVLLLWKAFALFALLLSCSPRLVASKVREFRRPKYYRTYFAASTRNVHLCLLLLYISLKPLFSQLVIPPIPVRAISSSIYKHDDQLTQNPLTGSRLCCLEHLIWVPRLLRQCQRK